MLITRCYVPEFKSLFYMKFLGYNIFRHSIVFLYVCVTFNRLTSQPQMKFLNAMVV